MIALLIVCVLCTVFILVFVIVLLCYCNTDYVQLIFKVYFKVPVRAMPWYLCQFTSYHSVLTPAYFLLLPLL